MTHNNNFETSLVVFMPNITTNHAITYTNWSLINTHIKLNLNIPLHVHVFLVYPVDNYCY